MHQYKSLMMVTVLGGVMVVMAGVLLTTEEMARKQKAGDSGRETEVWTPLGGRRTQPPVEILKRDLDRLRILAALEESPGTRNEFERVLCHAVHLSHPDGLEFLRKATAGAAGEPELLRAIAIIALTSGHEAGVDLALRGELSDATQLLAALDFLARLAPTALGKLEDRRLVGPVVKALRARDADLPPELEDWLVARIAPEDAARLKAEAEAPGARSALLGLAAKLP